MNTKIRTEAKTNFEKYFFKLMEMHFFGKTIDNVRKHRDHSKQQVKRRRRSHLVSEPNYHTKKCFSENLLATEMKNKMK